MDQVLNLIDLATNNAIAGLLIGALSLLFIYGLYSSIVIVGGDDVVMLERRWFGKKIAQGRIFALNNEVGIQARVLTPGLHFLLPFLYKTYKTKLTEINANEVGVVISNDGDSVEVGHIFAKVVNGHNHFQDGEAFLKNGGEKGAQISILPQGKYRINTLMFKVVKYNITEIGENEIGVILAEDGIAKTNNSLFANAVDGHNNFQDGEAFLKNGGGRGLQQQILTPGIYRINPLLFKVEIHPAIIIPAGKIGVVIAKDGKELPKGDVVAPSVSGHNSFQDSVGFLKSGGYKGSQLEVLVPAKYFINSYLFDVQLANELKIEVGSVAVITSSVGKLPDEEINRQIQGSQVKNNPESAVATESYVVPDGYRGVQNKYVLPGTVFLNPHAFSYCIVKTTNIVIDWNNSDDKEMRFNPLKVISKDGFEIYLSVKVIIRVLPEQAPYMVSKSGNVENLIHSVINPNIDASFRNQASNANAVDFLSNRDIEQKKAEEEIRNVLAKYHVECVSVLIVQIELPQSLLETKTKRVIAEQEMDQYKAQTDAEKARTELEKQTAFANQQSSLVQSELSITIAANNKQRAVIDATANAEVATKLGEGEQKKITAIATGEAARIKEIGEATAKAYVSQCEAIGKEQVGYIELIKIFSKFIQDNPNIKLVPDVVVGNGGGAMDGFFAQLARVFPQSNGDVMQGLIKGIQNNIESKEPEKQ